MNPYTKALQYAATKHAGQRRRNGDVYVIHPIRVSQEVKSTQQKIIALLHDTLEDTDATYGELVREFGQEVADAVECLTRRKDEEYLPYIERVKKNPDAVQVKLADIADNLTDSPSTGTIKRSAEAITILLSA